MRPSFHPRLINGSFDDPGLFIPFLHEKRALLLDLGDIHNLPARDILKVSHVFVTHTHMDHFTGFDRLIRLLLGRDKTLSLYGPKGFIKNVEGKLAGYSWNLVTNYKNRFSIHVTEVGGTLLTTKQYHCQDGFVPVSQDAVFDFNGTLYKEAAFSVSAIILDHQIPCLGLKVAERFHVNINKKALSEMGLEIGPWLNRFKHALFNNQDLQSRFTVNPEIENSRSRTNTFRLGDLRDRIALITPGQKVAYIVDTRYSEDTAARIIEFVRGVDHLYIEGAFLDQHHQVARDKYHLTAGQAGTIAGRAQVKQFSPMHFSPRYTDQGHLLEAEAKKAYDTAISNTSDN